MKQVWLVIVCLAIGWFAREYSIKPEVVEKVSYIEGETIHDTIYKPRPPAIKKKFSKPDMVVSVSDSLIKSVVETEQDGAKVVIEVFSISPIDSINVIVELPPIREIRITRVDTVFKETEITKVVKKSLDLLDIATYIGIGVAIAKAFL